MKGNELQAGLVLSRAVSLLAILIGAAAIACAYVPAASLPPIFTFLTSVPFLNAFCFICFGLALLAALLPSIAAAILLLLVPIVLCGVSAYGGIAGLDAGQLLQLSAIAEIAALEPLMPIQPLSAAAFLIMAVSIIGITCAAKSDHAAPIGGMTGAAAGAFGLIALVSPFFIRGDTTDLAGAFIQTSSVDSATFLFFGTGLAAAAWVKNNSGETTYPAWLSILPAMISLSATSILYLLLQHEAVLPSTLYTATGFGLCVSAALFVSVFMLIKHSRRLSQAEKRVREESEKAQSAVRNEKDLNTQIDTITKQLATEKDERAELEDKARRLEEDSRSLKAELDNGRTELNQLKGHLDNLQQTVETQIRKPVAGIIGMLDKLKSAPRSHEVPAAVGPIQRAAFSILTMIDSAAEPQQTSENQNLERIQVVDLVEGIGSAIAPLVREEGLGLYTYIDPAMPAEVLGDSVKLRQILFVLAGYALRTTATGYVAVTAEAQVTDNPGRTAIRFRVSDTGLGNTGDLESPDAFNEDLQTGRGGETGLAVAKRLVSQIGGDVTVSADPEGGSAVCLDASFDLPDDTGSKPAIDLDGQKIIIVSTVQIEQTILQQYLSHWHAFPALVESLEELEQTLATLRNQGDEVTAVITGTEIDVDSVKSIQTKLRSESTVEVPYFILLSRDAKPAHEPDNTIILPSMPLRLDQLAPAVLHRQSPGTEEEMEEDGPIAAALPDDASAGPIDPATLEPLTNGDADVSKEILLEFAGPAIDITTEIIDAQNSRSIRNIHAASRKFRSAAQTVGAYPLAQLCQDLENAAKSDDWETIDSIVPKLDGVIHEVLDYIDAL